MAKPYARLAILMLLTTPLFAIAQPQPDPSLWTNSLSTNPNGAFPVPLVIYNQVSGILSLDTLGVNRLDDTPDYTTEGGPIVGDDVALDTVSIDLIPPGNTLPSDYFILSPFDDMVFQNRVWVGAANTSFITLESVGLGGGNLFLLPGKYDLSLIHI